MAKEPKKALRNLKSSILILPNGDEVGPGETKPLPSEFAANAGVLAWVSEGLAEIVEE